MRTLSFCLATLFALSLTVPSAKADLFTLDLNTFDPLGWQVAQISVPGYVNPSGSSVGTQWSDQFADWGKLNWVDAVDGSRYTWGVNDNTPAGNFGDWVAMPGSGNDNKVSNNFYAFKYTLQAKDLSGFNVVTGTLNLDFGADDYLAAVYATNGNNGSLYDGSVGQSITTGGQWLDLNSLGFTDVELSNGLLDLIFVVHNTNAGGSDKDNPMGLYIDGTITTDVEMYSRCAVLPPRGGVAAAGGLPLVLRRRRNRKV